MRQKLIRTAKWFGTLIFFEVFTLATAILFNGDDSYMGGHDENLVKTGLSLYQHGIISTIVQVFMINLAVFFLLALPTLLFRKPRRWPALELLQWVTAFLALHFIWIFVAAFRIPTLFSEIYYGMGTNSWAGLFSVIASSKGPYVLGSFVAVYFALLLYYLPRSYRIGAIAYYAIFAACILNSQKPPERLKLSRNSILILMADSLRSDYLTAEHAPKTWTHFTFGPKNFLIQNAIPPIARTTPAVVSLFTGKLPAETEVREMFSDERSFQQDNTVINLFNDAGYCTIAIGEYPGDFLNKIHLGFRHIDAPTLRFKEIILQGVAKRSPFFLASFSWDAFREIKYSNKNLRNLFIGLPTFAGAHALPKRLNRLAEKCQGQPIFAYVFLDQPHFPYVQTWPEYLILDESYKGSYRYMKDAVSEPRSDEDRQRIRQLYAGSIRGMDATMDLFLKLIPKDQNITTVITGDHAESLYDKQGIMGHGDQISEWEGISTPWMVIGAEKETLADVPAEKFISTTHFAQWLGSIRGLQFSPSLLKKDEIYSETGLWMAETPNVPNARIRYPGLAELLSLPHIESHPQIKPEYQSLVDYAKHRVFMDATGTYYIKPLEDRVLIEKNGQIIPAAQLPTFAKRILEQYDSSLYFSIF
ncbi:sulfatase-like hydrolase/transferase [Oligoflexus tunisiensis]|uniref:sulfatase-like hydrolase/transferase n=1 Tax=Oligoflexus tunisiensis TaxID=708132 RepID=UPI00114CAF59|nr:sulfatase-like hydrolase/transferase [Oligoflexus tunisiensis]